MGWEREQIGDCTLYRGDCREVLSTLGKVNAVVTDPPYGTAFDFTQHKHRHSPLMGARSYDPWEANIVGDNLPFDPAPWIGFPQVILWGGHLFAADLPQSRAWLVWDKREGSTSDYHGDCELAWTNLRGPTRLHRQLWRGLVRAGTENIARGGAKLHPTQKPIALMDWCVQMTTGTVCDPFMGSGTTGVACVQLGRSFIGVEIEERYFRVACKRIEEAYRQLPLFPSQPMASSRQLTLV